MIKNRYAGWIFVLSAILFFGTNYFFEGSIKNIDLLAKELQATPEAVSEWNLKDKPPFNYRILFPAVIMGTFNILPTGVDINQKFYLLYSVFSMLFFIGAALSTYQLISQVISSPKLGFYGSLLFLISPPVFFAYTLPVHTREDMLAYIFLSMGLLAIIKKNMFAILVTFVFGVLTRETLLILPFIYLFYTDDPKIKKLLLSGLPVIIFILVRWIMGSASYDAWIGLKWNLSNLLQVIIFFFLSFHFMWIPFILVIIQKVNHDNQAISFIKKSAPITFFLVLSTTFLFGIFNEIRLMFLLYPWVIILCLSYFQNKKVILLQYIKSPLFFVLSVVMILFAVFIAPDLTERVLSVLGTSKHNTPYMLWIVSTYTYGSLAIFVLAFTFVYERKT